MRVIIGITGASGATYGIRLLEVLGTCGVETHLVISRWGRETVRQETEYDLAQVESMASYVYSHDDLAAPVSSGSFVTAGMVIAPCSMKTLAGIAHGYGDDLITRAASVCLKEGRKLIVLPRESPLGVIHLENMLRVAHAGAIVMPPMAAFYSRPQSILDLVDHTVGRVLDHLGIEHDLLRRWRGPDQDRVTGDKAVLWGNR